MFSLILIHVYVIDFGLEVNVGASSQNWSFEKPHLTPSLKFHKKAFRNYELQPLICRLYFYLFPIYGGYVDIKLD